MITLDSIDYSLHSIQIKDAAGDALAIGADGSLNVTDNGGSLTVDAVDLDIRDLAFATDSVDVTGSDVTVSNTVAVSATDLDIRDLAFATDKVDVSGSSVSISGGVTANVDGVYSGGNTDPDNVGIIAHQRSSSPVDSDQFKRLTADAYDTVLNPNQVLALDTNAFLMTKNRAGSAFEWVSSQNHALDVFIRDQDNPLDVSATDLDIRDLSHSQDSVKIGDGSDFLAINADGSINVQTFEGAYASWSVVAASVTTTESQLAASPLSGRLRIEIQNLGANDIYIRQATGVTTSNGLKIPKGSSYEQALDAGAAIYAIANSGSSDVRIAQYAA
jgi:hypothetical protein